MLGPRRAPEELLGLPVERARLPRGCELCRGTGYHGRTVVAELLVPDHDELARAILARADVRHLEDVAARAGMIDRWQRACTAVAAGLTSPEEVRRVLGFGNPPSQPAGAPPPRRAEPD